MRQSIYYLRYILVVIPGVATIYLSDRIASESLYVFLLLLYLLFLQLRDRKWEKRLSGYTVPPLLIIELIALFALTYHYEGLLPIAYYSSLLSLNHRPRHFTLSAFAIGIVLNINAYPLLPLELLLSVNLGYLCAAVLLNRFTETTGGKQDIEALYDELKMKHYDLEAARKTAVDYAKRVQELAQLEERNRIAHDLHDDLGHKLIRLKMMLEASTRLSSDNHDKAMEIVKEVRDQLSEGMESLRTTVRRLKPNQTSVSQYSLEGLISQIARESGIVAFYNTVGMPYTLYPSDEFILYRNAQEAITNAIRHGQATEVSVQLEYAADRLVMTVRNNGHVPDSEHLHKGLGLLGMEERLRVVGGSLHVATDPEFEIRTVLPRRETAVQP